MFLYILAENMMLYLYDHSSSSAINNNLQLCVHVCQNADQLQSFNKRLNT